MRPVVLTLAWWLVSCGTDEPLITAEAPDAGHDASAGTGGSGGSAGSGGGGPDAAGGTTSDAEVDAPLDAGADSGDSAPQCSAQWVDCNGDSTDGCEADLHNDPLNCGTCGHDCVLGQCQASECKPSTVSFSDGVVVAITVDATHVYWTTALGKLERVGKSAGSATFLTDAPGAAALAVADGFVYLATPSGIARYALSGGAGPVSFASADASGGLRVSGAFLYAGGAAALTRVALANAAINVLDPRPVVAFDLDATHAVHATSNPSAQIARVPLTGGTPASIVALQAPSALVVDATHVYFFDPELKKVAKSGGTPEILSQRTAQSKNPICTLVQSENRLYFASGDDIVSIRKDGTDERVLDDIAQTTCIAADESAMYYYSAIKGSIRQLAL